MQVETRGRTPLVEKLQWLADAPLFIDADQVDRFHDAVVRPEYDIGSTTLEINKEKATKIAGKLGLEASAEPNAILTALTTWLPFIKAEVKASAEGGLEHQRGRKEGEKRELRPIKTPQRQLEQLVLHYLLNHPDRLLYPDPVWGEEWRKPSVAIEVPRAVALLDLPPGTKFIPTAAEFADGTVELLFDKLKAQDGSPSPFYPDPYPVTDSEKLRVDRAKYWSWFDQNFNASKAMRVIEEAAATRKSAIRWIDYRVPASQQGETVHLHFAPHGQYDVGTFAYYLVKRGFKHGIRLVATVRSEPDLNVLAVYEK